MNTVPAIPPMDDLNALNDWFDRRFDERLAAREAAHVPSMTIIATKGTLDQAYPPFILASTGAALGWDVSIFFTFYGLELLKKHLNLRVTPLGNPAMPMKLPVGPQWLRDMEMDIPTSVMAITPGFEGFTSRLFKKGLQAKGVASIEELRELSVEAEVRMVACQMTVDLFGWKRRDFIDDIDDWVGAASFLPRALTADVNLFVWRAIEMKVQIRMYPPLWLLLFAGLAYGVSVLPVATPTIDRPEWLIALLVVLALPLLLGAAGLFRQVGTTIDPFGESSALVTRGPYRFTRNPMYLGMLLALTAWTLWLANPLALLLPPLFVWLITARHIRPEERRLQRIFGIEYADYCCRTRRWI